MNQDNNTQLSAYLQEIKDFLSSHYEPVHDYTLAEFKVSTDQFYEGLKTIYDFKDFTKEHLYSWLKEFGYIFVESSPLCFEWLLKSKVQSHV